MCLPFLPQELKKNTQDPFVPPIARPPVFPLVSASHARHRQPCSREGPVLTGKSSPKSPGPSVGRMRALRDAPLYARALWGAALQFRGEKPEGRALHKQQGERTP